MSTFAQTLLTSRSKLDRTVGWLWNIVRQELAPYPGRAELVSRMVLSSVLVMLVVMTFRIPGGAVAGYYTLLLSRDSPRATLAGAVELVISFGAGVAYIIVGAMLFFGSPVLHLLWIVGTFFVAFFAIRVLRSYSAAAGFGFLLATCIPIWDRTIPAETALEATLWSAADVALAALITVAVEYAFVRLRRFGLLEEGLIERWEAIEEGLRACGAGESGAGQSALDKFATVGVSRLRRVMLRSGETTEWTERMGVAVAVTEHLVDLTASLLHLELTQTEADCSQLIHAADLIRDVRLRFESEAASVEEPEWHAPNGERSVLPLLPEIIRNIVQLHDALEGRVAPRPITPVKPSRAPVFVADAFTNMSHVQFALLGCLATTACYITYNAIGWQGLNTSLATCIMTALSSVGSSRQKQLLRVTGAIVGGFVLGMGAQISILTGMDSITAFTVYFAAVTAIAAWFATSSARLSYFGLQLALAFFLINLQDPAFQGSLTIARDRVIGYMLGLFMMWLCFDLISGVRAVDEMLRRFRRSIQLMVALQRLSSVDDPELIRQRSGIIRDDLISTFGNMNTQADAILFETGADRARDLILREQVLSVQPALRSLLLLEVTALQYRRERLIHQLPADIAEAQSEFDGAVTRSLEHVLDPDRSFEEGLRASQLRLQDVVTGHYRLHDEGRLPTAAEAMLALSRSMMDSIVVIRAAAAGISELRVESGAIAR